jgi:hypothetical protein
MYLERSTYTTMDLLIGNGDYINAGPASAFIYVKDHANLSIRGAVDEGFHNSIFIRGGDRSSPIHLDNNFIQSKLTVNDSTVVSTGNQFYSTPGNFIDAVATGGSQIFSYGDKFCLEGHGCPTRGYIPSGGAQVVTSVNGFKASSNIPTYMDNILSIAGDNYSGTPLLSVMAKSFAGDSLLRLGRGSFWFDVTRSETDGSLTFKGNQNDYSRYTFDTANGGKVQINNDGSVTYGTVAYSALGAAYYTTQNGTVVYCSNCTKSTPCGSGGSGALAKRINGSWDCD